MDGIPGSTFKVVTAGAQLLAKQAKTKAEKQEADFINIQELTSIIEDQIIKCRNACKRASLYGLADFPPDENEMKIPNPTPQQERLMPVQRANNASRQLWENVDKIIGTYTELLWDKETKEILHETKGELLSELPGIINASKFDPEVFHLTEGELECAGEFLSERETAKRVGQLSTGIYSERVKALRDYANLKYRDYPKVLPRKKREANRLLSEFRASIISPISGKGSLIPLYRKDFRL